MISAPENRTVDSFARRFAVAKAASGNPGRQRISDDTTIAVSDIRAFQSGAGTPTFQERRELAKALGVPPIYLTRPWPVVELVSLRDRRSLAKRDRQRIQLDIEIAFGNYYAVEDVLEEPLPPADFMNLREVSGSTPTTDEIERIASEMRSALGIDRNDFQPDVHELLDRRIRLLPFDAPSDSAHGLMDGCVVKSDRGDYAIAFCRSVSVDRQRFTLIHELGHLVSDDPTDEAFSDQCAAAILMPRDQFESEFESHSLDALLRLKGMFGCSVAALNRRGRDLGLISEQAYLENQKRLSYRGWRKHEPEPHPPLKVPQYGRYSDLCVAAWQREQISESRLSQLLGEVHGGDWYR